MSGFPPCVLCSLQAKNCNLDAKLGTSLPLCLIYYYTFQFKNALQHA